MQAITVTPKMERNRELGLDEVRIMPIGDIQFGAQGCDVERLKAHIAWGVKHKCYFVGMGDYLDVASPSNRAKLKGLGLYDTVVEMMDNAMRQELEKIKEILRPTKGRWLGLVRGHHFWEFTDGTTTDTLLADYLGCAFLGDLGIINVRLGKSLATVYVTHGKGSGTTAGAPLNFMQNIARSFRCHVILTAHRHAKPVVPIPYFEFESLEDGTVLHHAQNCYLVGCGGFLKGYQLGSKELSGWPGGNYIEKALLAPVTLGGPLVKLRPRFRQGRHMVDINVEV